ncbi:MAG: amine oxidase [Segetibacter sp.]|nr:amine oxidase [Segetibacter sp.]
MNLSLSENLKPFRGDESPFSSFWMAGYECSDKLNAFGNRVDLLTTTGHLQLMDEDYKLLQRFNIKTVREGVRWSVVEKRAYQYDWSTTATMIQKGKANNIQQVWDLCHFGFPDDLTPLHPLFAKRFAAFCRSFINFYRSILPNEQLVVTPINEVSFLSWLGGDARGTTPYCWGRGWDVKYALMRAFIEGVAAMKEIDPTIKILTTEPLINMVPPVGATDDEIAGAAQYHEWQFQSVDILIGKVSPELGGCPEYLDIAGFNYYYNNQWIAGTPEFLHWYNKDKDPRFTPLSTLLSRAYDRFQCPIALTETSHPEEDRPLWIKLIAEECATVIEEGIPFWGICLYPIIDRPDWDHFNTWHRAGLWDATIVEGQLPTRELFEPYAEALLEAQALIAEVTKGKKLKVA